MMQRFTEYLFKHRWQALVLTFLCTFVPVLGALSILFAALVTLRKGAVEGGVFTLAATIPYISSLYGTMPSGVPPTVVWCMLGVLMISNILTWVLAVSLQQQKKF